MQMKQTHCSNRELSLGRAFSADGPEDDGSESPGPAAADGEFPGAGVVVHERCGGRGHGGGSAAR
jgi:hypothetical protein